MTAVDYPAAMSIPAPYAKPRGVALMLAWPRVRFTLLFSFALGALMGLGWHSGWWSAVTRVMTLGMIGLLAFGLFEQWPENLPKWLARWILQVLGVAVSMPIGTFLIWLYSTHPGAPQFWHDMERMKGFAAVTGLGIFLSPWVALGALVRQKDAMARHQALAFELERSELERQALDARLHLLQAQVSPHFLFNTLANIQALVESGSPQAAAVLRSLVAYLRAAVPRLNEPATTLGQELELVQAYLELMHMRMPDRLQFTMHVDEAARSQHCPPMTLLTLVENAVRHGIDPSEEGGRIDIQAQVHGERCIVRVSDTGVGLQPTGAGLGTGLSMLRERLRLVFGGEAHLRVTEQHPRGVSAELDLPLRQAVP